MAQLNDTTINGNLYVSEDIQIGNVSVTDKIDELDIVKDKLEVDYIVEQGTSGIWTYRKWNSGIAECWGIYVFSTTINNAWGSLYESPQITLPSFPFTFKEIPFASLTPASGSYVFFVEVGGGITTSQPGIIWASRPKAEAGSVTCKVNIHAIGKWK